MLKRFSATFFGQCFLLFGGFAICRILCNAVFFEGFLSAFSAVNSEIPFLGKLSLFTHDPFHSSSIILSALVQPFFLLLLLLLYIPFFLKRKELRGVFSSLPRYDRLIICICALLLAWELSTYDYNYYLDRTFYFDRILLITLAILIFRFPVITPFFIAASFVYRSQFNFPVEGFPLFDKRLLFDLLEMFLVLSYLKLFIKEFRVPFLFAVMCIIGSNYFMSFAGKIIISPHGYEWLWHDRVADLFANVHLRGWITNDNTFQKMYAFIQKFDGTFRLLILLAEFSGILLLRKRKWAIAFLSGFFIMHIGIFLFGSMLFWKWMILDLLLIFILIKYRTGMEELFNRKFFGASLAVIATSFIWLQPYRIAWWDTACNQCFTYEVVADDGKIYSLDKNEMNPYHQWFEYDHFLFLVNKPTMRLTGFGYVNSYDLKCQMGSGSKPALPSSEAFRNDFDSLKKTGFDNFIKQYFQNRNSRIGISFFLRVPAAPDHLHSSVPPPAYNGNQKVGAVRVYLNVSQSVGTKSMVQREMVDEIVIPD